MKRLNEYLRKIWHFVTYDIWRITDKELSRSKSLLINLLKVILLSLRGFSNNALQTKAAALTYFTLLSFVPMLAVIMAVANGFGYKSILKSQLFDYFPGQRAILDKAIDFSETYLASLNNEIIVGVGLLFLLYTVFSLISAIERMFNDIWQVSKDRTFVRKLTDYLSVIIFIPTLLTISSGVSIFLSTFFYLFQEYYFISPIVGILLKILPFIITIFIFTAIYIFIPNTKVRFAHAFYAGIVAGIAFQCFQFLYISGQLWVSRYSSIYGSFAALPLFLLWLDLSWLITLFGAKLAFAGQNVRQFDFEQDSKRTSRRFKDFTAIVLMALIVKYFEKGELLRTADELSQESGIPLLIVKKELNRLTDAGLLVETNSVSKDRMTRYFPAFDIHKMSVGIVLRRLDELGNEDFKVDVEKQFTDEWFQLIEAKKRMFDSSNDVLLVNLK